MDRERGDDPAAWKSAMNDRNEVPSVARLKEFFTYDALTGVLRFADRIDLSAPHRARWSFAKAGTKSTTGYLYVRVDGTQLMVHRIAWKMHYGTDPPRWLDHIDGKRMNNRIANLRKASGGQNAMNARKHLGKVLPKGVTLRADTGKYRVIICLRRKLYHLGHFTSVRKAAAVYREAAVRLHGAFARFA